MVYTFNYCRPVFQTWERAELMVDSHELSILHFVFAPVSENCVDTLTASLSYPDNTCVNNALGVFMLNYVFYHTIFLNPGVVYTMSVRAGLWAPMLPLPGHNSLCEVLSLHT